jgi:hypothetical protein
VRERERERERRERVREREGERERERERDVVSHTNEDAIRAFSCLAQLDAAAP